MQSIAASFRADWEQGIAGLPGVSAGAVRSLRAYAEADVAETMATIADAGDLGPGRAAGVLTAWIKWHSAYVQGEIARLLPELVERWPTKAERRRREITRQRRQRWGDDGARVVEALANVMTPDVLSSKLQLRSKRFSGLLGALKEIGAVRELAGGRLVATASVEWTREKLALHPQL